MKYYYEPNDQWYNTKQELVDAYNEDFEGTHSTKVTIDNWTEEQWDTIWKPSMKKLEIKTEKATLLVVDFSLDRGKSIAEALLCNPNLGNKEFKGFKLLGKVSEITEEEWKDITEDGDMTPSSCMYTVGYRDYTIDELTPMFEFDNATESGLSLLKANGVILEPKSTPLLSSAWMEAQQEVWSNPHVFIKIERGN